MFLIIIHCYPVLHHVLCALPPDCNPAPILRAPPLRQQILLFQVQTCHQCSLLFSEVVQVNSLPSEEEDPNPPEVVLEDQLLLEVKSVLEDPNPPEVVLED